MKYKVGDGVTFIVGESAFTYTVYSEYLHYQKGGGNHTIFRVLGISEKEEFCKNCYGYTPNGGEFPQYKKGDYEAAQRVIDALKKECQKHNAESIIQASTKLKQSITKPDDDMPATYYDSTPKQCKLIKPTSSEVVLTIKHKSYKF